MVEELTNSRRAIGYLGVVEEPHEFKGKLYSTFHVRYIKQGSWYRVTDYVFSAGPVIIEMLQMIEPNMLVHVFFEIECKPHKSINMMITKLKATGVMEYGDAAPEWVWHIQDWTKRDEVVEMKKKYPKAPDIEMLFDEPQMDKKIRKKSLVNGGYSVKDKVTAKKPFVNKEEDESNLPF